LDEEEILSLPNKRDNITMKLKALVNDKGALDTWISKNFIDPRNSKVAK